MPVSVATPLVSILLPAFNAAATLPACLRSILRQCEPRWECVLVDDGSEDDTLACAAAHARGDGRVRVVERRHEGLVATLNAGLEHCRGRYVARMDADDVMHRQRLAAQVAALEASPDLAGVGSHVRIWPRQHLQAGWRAYERWLNSIGSARQVRAEAFVECPIVHPTLMMRREILARIAYRDCDWPEDYDLLLRVLAAGHDIGVVPRRLLGWRDSAARLTHTDARYAIDRFAPCKAAFLAAQFLAATDTYILWGFGHTGRALHRALLAHGKRLAYLVDVHPGRVGNIIHGAPTIAPDALARLRGVPVVVSVARESPRQRIRAAMREMGFEELRDFVCAA
jgi:glycosyltransferase involved in cell wall biosynthesis